MSEQTIAAPLSGEDIVEAILDEVRRSLLRDCHLNPVLAYEAFSGEIWIKLRLRDNGREPEVEREVRVQHLAGASLYMEEPAEVRLVLEERPPNVVREKAGLAIPTLVQDGSGKKEVRAVKYAARPTTEKESLPGEKPPDKPPDDGARAHIVR